MYQTASTIKRRANGQRRPPHQKRAEPAQDVESYGARAQHKNMNHWLKMRQRRALICARMRAAKARKRMEHPVEREPRLRRHGEMRRGVESDLRVLAAGMKGTG